jgi:integrase
MRPAHFKFVLRTSTKDKRDLGRIYLRIISYYKVQYISVGRSLHRRFWNKERGQVRRNHPDSVEINEYLEHFLTMVEDKYRRGHFDAGSIGKNSLEPDVISFLDTIISDRNRAEQFRTRQKYVTLRNRLIEFKKTNRIPFDSIDKLFVREFDSFLQLECDNGTNTRIKHLDQLRRTINLGIEEGLLFAQPFPKLKMRKEETEKLRLSMDQIERLRQYAPPANSLRYHAKNMFLLSFFIGGSRFEDTLLLEWHHLREGNIHFIMGKTGKQYRIRLIPEALEIIDRYAYRRGEYKYLFPVMPEHVTREDIVRFKKTVNCRNVLINKQLAAIALDLGIERFTFHCARHSIADYLRLKKVDLYTISKVLRHSNIRTTEIYLKKFDQESVSAEFAKAFVKEHQEAINEH